MCNKYDFNFDSIYNYIESQQKKYNTSFYSYQNYEFHLKDNSEIILKKDSYTLSKVIKGNGILSLAKVEKDNKEMVKKTNQLLLEILGIGRKKL